METQRKPEKTQNRKGNVRSILPKSLQALEATGKRESGGFWILNDAIALPLTFLF